MKKLTLLVMILIFVVSDVVGQSVMIYYDQFTTAPVYNTGGDWRRINATSPSYSTVTEHGLILPRLGFDSHISYNRNFTLTNFSTLRLIVSTNPSPDDAAPVHVTLIGPFSIRMVRRENQQDVYYWEDIRSGFRTWILSGFPHTLDILIQPWRLSFPISVEITSDVGSASAQRGYLDYFELSCIDFCSGIATATPTIMWTPIVYPTSVPRTNTPNPTYTGEPPTQPPIELTRPSSSTQPPNCGVYQCGSLDQSFPVLPPLDSPTPLIFGGIGTGTPIVMVTEIGGDYVSPTPLVGDNGNNDNLGGYIDGDGVLTPQNPDDGIPSLSDLGSGALSVSDNQIFISYLKGIYDDDVDYFGPFAPIVQVALAVISMLFLMMTAQFIIPIAVLFIGLARKAWTALMDVIPF